MKKVIYAVLIAAIIVGAYCAHIYQLTIPQNKITNLLKTPAPQAKALETPVILAPVENKKILNLALPKNTMLVDPPIVVPEDQHKFDKLFIKEQKESNVKIGGSLILDDKPPEPNAAVWDAVKGAEVGITIKTP